MRRGGVDVLVPVAAATALLVLAAVSLGAVGATELVSGPNPPGHANFLEGDMTPAISGNGRFIAFVHSLGDAGSTVFLRDMNGGLTPIAAESFEPSLSRNGRYLAFVSANPTISDEDRDLHTTPAGYTHQVSDVFVYDTATGALSLASRRTGPTGAGGNENSTTPSISADGRYVTFQSDATNLRHGRGGVFVRDLRRNTTTPASPPNGNPEEVTRDNRSTVGGYVPSISAHGARVAFLTDVHSWRGSIEVAVSNVKGKRMIFASRANGRYGHLAFGRCKQPAISADGRYVAFSTRAKGLSRADHKRVQDVFVRDLKRNRTILVSRRGGRHGVAGNGDSFDPSISADGRYVSFTSYATNLAPGDNDRVAAVFVRDMHSGRVFLASSASDSAAANAPSAHSAISADGRYVAFDSRASNLDPVDTLRASSVFRHQLR